MSQATLFNALLDERGWRTWETFCEHFAAAARDVARQTGSRRFASVTVGRTTFDRWASGSWSGRPRREAAQVLEQMLGRRVDDLFSPASTSDLPTAPGTAASLLDRPWATSRLLLSSAEADGVWELSGGDSLDGTAAAVRLLDVSKGEGGALVAEDGSADVRQFLRPARRGFVVGVEERADDPQAYVRDTGPARTRWNSGAEIAFPDAYLLDDLTYGIIWAAVQLDDGLLADDRAIDAEHQVLDTYLSLPRSAPSRQLTDLSTVGTGFVGSAFCARHITHHLREAREVPVFWTREQTGAESAPWLFFRHKLEYLRELERFRDGSGTMRRVFCVPDDTVSRMDQYERILLLLTVALMERYGIRVQIVSDASYAEVDGVALVPGQRAIVANWVRVKGEALWVAGSTKARGELRGYAGVFGDAAASGLLDAEDAGDRLQQFAEHLGINWNWMTTRSRALGECGVSGLVMPRSRLLSTEAIEDALVFLGTLGPAR